MAKAGSNTVDDLQRLEAEADAGKQLDSKPPAKQQGGI
jgi:hypothetical protein